MLEEYLLFGCDPVSGDLLNVRMLSEEKAFWL